MASQWQYPGALLVIVHKAVEGVSGTMLARFLNRGRRTLKLDGEVTLLLASSAELRRLNREFRAPGLPNRRALVSLQRFHGMRAISPYPPTSRGRTADVLGHGAAIEIKTLILHGLLHLAGYDHETDNGRMARKETVLRSALGSSRGIDRAREPPCVRAAG